MVERPSIDIWTIGLLIFLCFFNNFGESHKFYRSKTDCVDRVSIYCYACCIRDEKYHSNRILPSVTEQIQSHEILDNFSVIKRFRFANNVLVSSDTRYRSSRLTHLYWCLKILCNNDLSRLFNHSVLCNWRAIFLFLRNGYRYMDRRKYSSP